jgi:hypothetical protein
MCHEADETTECGAKKKRGSEESVRKDGAHKRECS